MPFILFLFLTVFVSCEKREITADPNWQAELYEISEADLQNFNDKIALEVGKAIGIFMDEMTRDGMQEYLNRVKELESIPPDDLSNVTVSEIESIFNAEEGTIDRYISTLQIHQIYIANPENRINVAIGMYKYAEASANEITRGVFRVAATLFSAKECGFWQHAARIADTALLTATASTGIGAVGAAGSLVETYHYAIKCCKENGAC